MLEHLQHNLIHPILLAAHFNKYLELAVAVAVAVAMYLGLANLMQL
jgi:hypothetical protein